MLNGIERGAWGTGYRVQTTIHKLQEKGFSPRPVTRDLRLVTPSAIGIRWSGDDIFLDVC
jgi:hypothetical protein